MIITVDSNSGLCSGVARAIKTAENTLAKKVKLFCLGDIVHNSIEVSRLKENGMLTINHSDLLNLKNYNVLIRAHGEPPSTFDLALKNKIELVDCTCEVVLKLQNDIKTCFDSHEGQIVILGREDHPEVIGLNGQTKNTAIIITNEDDLDEIDYSQNIYLFSQTTKQKIDYENIVGAISKRVNPNIIFEPHCTICKTVLNRESSLKTFSNAHDAIIFVSDKKSSNGNMLYKLCKSVNSNTYFISKKEDIDWNWLSEVNTVGICGATSTPLWLLKEIELYIKSKSV